MTDESAPAPPASSGMSAQDLFLPIVPSVITSLGLEALSELSGTAKIGIAAVLSMALWWFTTGRRSAAARRGAALARSSWRRILLAIVALAVLALVITRFVFDRPTLFTAGVALVALAVTAGAAFRGRRAPAAGAVAVAGGLIGLCLGIAVL